MILRYTLFLVLFISANAFCQTWHYQAHLSSNTTVVYASDVNVRMKPSLKSKVIGKLQAGDVLNNKYTHVADTINGTPGYWLEIKTNHQTG